ncbi:DUF1648 domain-containing protein [Cellulomonas xylanilytica]|uniref:DUF1648 domain-containing protein n=1 Tax=Cellulomonas xylanilytica TaxID=233583 RepID=A0A510V4L0_9CELL|nr:DUF1648 domain-containing protein [Cellulomonas xylanilytica]GEK20841.1 hypothetical protein CXY01_13610 [Cellulomonas xylanilytica]
MTSPVPYRSVTTVLTLVVPLALAAVPFVVAGAWASELPDQVAVHFGADGPDRYASVAGAIWPTAIATVVVAVASWALAFFWGRTAQVRRVAAATAVGMAAFLSTLVVGMLDVQRGLTDTAGTTGLGLVMTVAFAVGIGAAALAAWAVPRDAHQPAQEPVPPTAAVLDLGPDEAAVWVTHAESRSALVIGSSVALLTLALGLLLGLPFLAVPAVLVAAIVLSSTWFTVMVDRRGLTVRSAVGWPRFSVPIDEIREAAVTTVSPLAEFGGWGYRVGRGGRVGVVLRTGEGLQVERTGGRAFVVTVDDAATGAALLNTLAARSRVG